MTRKLFSQGKAKHSFFLFRNNSILFYISFMFLAFPANSYSQTVVKLMSSQAEQLKINLEPNQYFGDELIYTLGNSDLVSGGTTPYWLEWSKGSEIVSYDTTFIVTPNQNDVYKLTVTDSCECTATINITLLQTGLNDFITNTVSIFPNPAKNYIRIVLSNDYSIYSGVLLNTMGIAVWTGEISNNLTIPLNYPSGYYFLVLTNEGEKIKKKIIIL